MKAVDSRLLIAFLALALLATWIESSHAAPPTTGPSAKAQPTVDSYFAKPDPEEQRRLSESKQQWTARPDMPSQVRVRKKDLRLVVQMKGEPQFLYPAQTSDVVLVGNSLTSTLWKEEKVVRATWDLITGQPIGQIEGKTRMGSTVVSPDGLYFAGTCKGEDDKMQVEAWSIQTGPIARLATSAPADGPNRVIGFATEGPIFAAEGRLSVWDLKAGKVTRRVGYVYDAQGDGFAASLTGRLVAVVNAKRVLMIDTTAADVLGEVSIPTIAGQQQQQNYGWGGRRLIAARFSPDGTALAAMIGEGDQNNRARSVRVLMWEVATGRLGADFDVELPENNDAWNRDRAKVGFDWLPAADGWIVNNEHLVDRVTGKVVYTIPPRATDRYEDTGVRKLVDQNHVLYSYSARDRGMGFESIKLPRADIDRAAAAVQSGGEASDAQLQQPLTTAVRDDVRLIEPGGDNVEDFQPDAAGLKKYSPQSIPIKADTPPRGQRGPSWSERISKVLFARDAGKAFVEHVKSTEEKDTGSAWKRTKTTVSRIWVERCDLVQGTKSTPIELPVIGSMIDVSPDAKWMLVRSAGGRLDLYSVSQPKEKHVVGWRPYADEPADKAAVAWAAILDETHVLSSSSQGRVTMWEVPACRAVWEISTGSFTRPVMSVSRKQMALRNEHGLYVLDAMSGRTLRTFNPRYADGDLAFSLDGATLMGCSGGGSHPGGSYGVVATFDLKKGKPLAEIRFTIAHDSNRGGPRAPTFVTPPYVVVNSGQYLIDVENNVVLWRFTRNNAQTYMGDSGDGRFWFVTERTGDRPMVLASIQLPHAEAMKIAKTLAPEVLLAVQPGATVGLELNVGGDEALREKVGMFMRRQLENNGLKIAEGDQPIKLVATVGKTTKTQEYTTDRFLHPFQQPRDVQTASYDVTETRVEFVVQGKVIWSSSQTQGWAPGNVQLEEGESLQAAVNRSQPRVDPTGFFGAVILPKFVPYPDKSGGFGYAKLTPRGPEPAQPPVEYAPPR